MNNRCFFVKGLLFLMLSLLCLSVLQAQNWDEVIKIVASDRGAQDKFGISVAISGDYAIVGAFLEDDDDTGLNPLSNPGSVYIFERSIGGVWNEVKKITASDRGAVDYFGFSVDISGDYAIVGSYRENEDAIGLNTMNDAGSAYVFERNGSGVWNEVQKLVASDREGSDQFGVSVAISGDYAIVGSQLEDDDVAGLNTLSAAGSSYIFERNVGGTWNEVQKLVASDRGVSDRFGHSVAISGGYVIVGAFAEDHDVAGVNGISNAGAAYIFERNISGSWSERQKLVASDRGLVDKFGIAVAISNDYVIIGAHSKAYSSLNDAGAAYIFERNIVGVWNEVQKLVASDVGSQDNFGISVAISGDNAVVGAYLDSEDLVGSNYMNSAGSAYVFERNSGGNWLETQKIVASDRSIADYFGRAVAIFGDYFLVGAHGESEDPLGLNTLGFAGSVYLFSFCLPTSSSYSLTTCGSYTVPSNDETYTAMGTYPITDTIPNSCGKDSIMTITITILPALIGGVTNTICNNDSVVVNGTTYNATNPGGTEVFTNIGPNNCDSTVTIALNVLSALTGSVTNTICNESTTGVVVNGTTYNLINPSGTEVFQNIGPNNCDSTVTVALNVLPAIDTSTSTTGFVITSNQLGVTYQWLDCNNGFVSIAGETNINYTATANGDYAVEVTVGNCSDTSACNSVTTVGIANNYSLTNDFILYPSPTTGMFIVLLTDFENTIINVYDVLGQQVSSQITTSNKKIIDLTNNVNGLYFVRIITKKGAFTKRIIKQ